MSSQIWLPQSTLASSVLAFLLVTMVGSTRLDCVATMMCCAQVSVVAERWDEVLVSHSLLARRGFGKDKHVTTRPDYETP